MLGRRISSFIFETFVLLPITLLINVCALLPVGCVMMLVNSDGGAEFTNILFFGLPLSFVAGWGIAFFLNKLRLRIKGKKTDEYYEVEYRRVTSRLVERYDGYYDIYSDVHNGTRIESDNTGWGILGIILCFVAFPLQIVASLASFIALFVPVIYSTSRMLPSDVHFSVGNQILHILFDFVIIPYRGPKLTSHFDQKSLLWVLGYVLTPVFFVLLFLLIADLIEAPYIGVASILLLLALLFAALTTLVLVIKYTILTLFFYDHGKAKRYLTVIATASLVTAVILALLIIFS